MGESMFVIALLLTLVLQGHSQVHAGYLAATGNWHHSNLTPLLEVCDWAGENLYRGHSDPEIRWGLYADSPGHAAVMNYPWTDHAVGTAQMSDGRWVVVDIFCVATVEAPPDNRAAPRAATPVAARPPEAPVYVPIGSPPPLCSNTQEVPCLL